MRRGFLRAPCSSSLAVILASGAMPGGAVHDVQRRLREHVHVEAEPYDLVEISFVVHDRAGEPVAGLGKDDFLLKVNRVETSIEALTKRGQVGDVPLSIVFLVDVSGSMGKIERQRFLAASRKLLGRLRPIDEMMLVTFADAPKVHCDFTNDDLVLSRALETAVPADFGAISASDSRCRSPRPTA